MEAPFLPPVSTGFFGVSFLLCALRIEPSLPMDVRGALLRFDACSMHDFAPARRLVGDEFGICSGSGGGDIGSLRGQTFA